MPRFLASHPTHKYGARAVVVDGERFDSTAEATRYQQLRLLERAGEIRDLRIHPRYVLLDAFIDRRGKRHAGILYEADFEYRATADPEQWTTEDVKGVETPVWRLKVKLFLAKWGDLHELRVIRAADVS